MRASTKLKMNFNWNLLLQEKWCVIPECPQIATGTRKYWMPFVVVVEGGVELCEVRMF